MAARPTDHRPEPDSYLSFVLGLLWPEPAQVSPVRRLRDRRGKQHTAVVVMPSAAKPKLIVPTRPRRVAAATVRNFNTGSARRKQLMINALAMSVRVGAADLMPSRLRVDYAAGVRPTDIESHLSEVLGQRIRVGVWIGPARAVRKPVLQILDERGRTLGFAKLGVNEFTRQLVRAEADAVGFLAGRDWSDLRVPAIMHTGLWREHELLVQTAFPRGQNEGSTDQVHRAMDELARARGVEVSPLAQSPYWHKLTHRLASLPDTNFKARLRDASDAIVRTSADTPIEFGSWHGDWTPWNMTVFDGHVCVWDWEKFETGVPIGFDAVHFGVHGPVVAGECSARAAFDSTLERVGTVFGQHGISADVGALIVWLYAVDLAVTYLTDRESELGDTRMSRLSTWLEPVLDAAAQTVAARKP